MPFRLEVWGERLNSPYPERRRIYARAEGSLEEVQLPAVQPSALLGIGELRGLERRAAESLLAASFVDNKPRTLVQRGGALVLALSTNKFRHVVAQVGEGYVLASCCAEGCVVRTGRLGEGVFGALAAIKLREAAEAAQKILRALAGEPADLPAEAAPA